MQKILLAIMFTLIFSVMGFAADRESHMDPVKENVILRLNTENRVTNSDLQKMFTALVMTHLKNNTSYLLAYQVFRDQARQSLPPSITLTELDYGTFTIINIRYSFSNGYFEFKISQTPFTNIVNDEAMPSIDYNGIAGQDLYRPINDRLQEAVYISRGYAAMHKKRSSASFYIFK